MFKKFISCSNPVRQSSIRLNHIKLSLLLIKAAKYQQFNLFQPNISVTISLKSQLNDRDIKQLSWFF